MRRKKPCELCGAPNGNYHNILNVGSYPVIRCNRCGLIYIDHVFTRGELESFYTAEAYPREEVKRSNSYLDQKVGYFEQWHELLTNYVRKGKILDVGCGGGSFLKFLKDLGFETFGVEISADACAFAREIRVHCIQRNTRRG